MTVRKAQPILFKVLTSFFCIGKSLWRSRTNFSLSGLDFFRFEAWSKSASLFESAIPGSLGSLPVCSETLPVSSGRFKDEVWWISLLSDSSSSEKSKGSSKKEPFRFINSEMLFWYFYLDLEKQDLVPKSPVLAILLRNQNVAFSILERLHLLLLAVSLVRPEMYFNSLNEWKCIWKVTL